MLLSFSIGSFEVPKVPNKKELECLATNIYHEARGEPLKGQVAVALVTLNRVADPRYPKTICKVVFQKNQFSWTNVSTKIVYDLESLDAAIKAVNYKGVFEATHYHATHVNPNWKLKQVAKIGNHVFYV